MAWGWIDSPAVAGETAFVHSERASLVNSPWHPQVVPLAGVRALTVRSTLNSPPELSIVSATEEVAGWSTLNTAIEHQRGFTVQDVHWSDKGVELEGLVAIRRHQDRSCPLAVDFRRAKALRDFIEKCGDYSLESCWLFYMGHMRRVGEEFPAGSGDSLVDLAHHVRSCFVVLPGYKKSRH
jgi:hypothetical protein